MALGIICALRSEAPRLGPAARVVGGGVGRANAAAAAEKLASAEPLTGLIAAGYAGALSGELGIGDLVVDTSVPEWMELARREGAMLGRVVTADRVLTSRAERAALTARTGALAVDMESEAVAGVARRLGLRFAAVRAITDSTVRDLVLDWNGLRRPDGSFRILALLLQALRTPQGVAEIRQLWYASRIASRNLARFLRTLSGSGA